MAATVRCILASFSRRRFSGEQALTLRAAFRTWQEALTPGPSPAAAGEGSTLPCRTED